jgi:bifunctional pyridoxal-dependent enzyme with beta-cystathionase and maltose regulon repressor activities
MKNEMFGWPSVVSDELVQSVDQKNCERWHFTISELSFEFAQVSRTVLYEIITARLGYHNFLCKMQNVHRCTQNPENGFGFNFLEQYHKDGDEFLNHILQVTGDETGLCGSRRK